MTMLATKCAAVKRLPIEIAIVEKTVRHSRVGAWSGESCMRTILWKSGLLVGLGLAAGCGGNKDKNINKDRDRPQSSHMQFKREVARGYDALAAQLFPPAAATPQQIRLSKIS